MSVLLHISTAVPEYKVEQDELTDFYVQAVAGQDPDRFRQKIAFLNRKTRIEKRYSCIPDYKGSKRELFTQDVYKQPVEKRMALYRDKILPLAASAVDDLFAASEVKPSGITHLITVSCTGLYAPGLEYQVAERFGLQHAEKTALNFLGCYAAIKALKYANYMAQANPMACVLIVCAELCSLHFHPSDRDEDLIANLLFSDGAAAVLVCGDKNPHVKEGAGLRLSAEGSACIPGTADLMTWELSSSAFKMHLSPEVVQAIKDNIHTSMAGFMEQNGPVDHWAIHPGGVKIVEAAQQSLGLADKQVAHSLSVLRDYGNMSSPTVLFVLKRILEELKSSRESVQDKKIIACAFGPGLTIELLSFCVIGKDLPEMAGETVSNRYIHA